MQTQLCSVRTFLLLSYTGRECDVAPYTETYDAIKNIPIVSAATVWTSLESTETYILVFNEGLWMQGEMDHSLINPNQMWHNGATVQHNHFSPSPLFIETAEADFFPTFGNIRNKHLGQHKDAH